MRSNGQSAVTLLLRKLIFSLVMASLSAALYAQPIPDLPPLRRNEPPPTIVSLAPEMDGILTRMLEPAQREELERAIQQQLVQDLDYGMRPRSVRAVLGQPLSTLPATVMGRQSFTGTEDLLKLYAYEYAIDELCYLPLLPMPASLEEAADQIESQAARITETLAGRWSDRDRRWLQENWLESVEVLREQPHTSNLRRSDRRLLRRFFERLDSADRASLLCETRRWMQFVSKPWRDTLRGLLEQSPRRDEGIILRRQTEYGEIRFAGSQSQNHQLANVLFLADFAGDDIHGIEAQAPFTGRPQFILDFAGNDVFEATRPGSLGSSLGSVGILIDQGGDEHYDSPILGLGASVAGFGLVLDIAGSDEYRSVAMSQGFGLFGLGLLLDEGTGLDMRGIDADRYSSRLLSQGVGMADGIGLLMDEKGRDRYIAKGEIPTNYGTPGLSDAWSQGVGVGQRGLAAGGIGLLIDREGSDRYDGSSFSQGGGYYFGFGGLWDLGRVGDEYLGARYSFGWAAHAGVAHFHEAGGSDRYRSRQIVAAGPAWDHSVVFFEDMKGNDRFEMGEFSLGAAAYRSLSVFVDRSGADEYRRSSRVKADEGEPNVALFVDLGEEADSLGGELLPPGCSRSPEVGMLCDSFDFETLRLKLDDAGRSADQPR